MGLRDRIADRASAAVRFSSDHAGAIRGRARQLRADWRRRRFFAKNPSTAQDAGVRDRENSFYQQAKGVVSDVESIEYSNEYAQRAQTAQERRDARGDAVSTRQAAKRAFPHLVRTFERDIDGTSDPQVLAASQSLLASLKQYLTTSSLSSALHPTDALEELRSAMHEQGDWEFEPTAAAGDGAEPNSDEEGVEDEIPAEVFATDRGHQSGRDGGIFGRRSHRGEPADPPASEPCADDEYFDWKRAPLEAKRAGDPAYRSQLLAGRYAPHVAPFNNYVDQLRDSHGEWLPYVAPTYGGIDARVLALFQDPGPKTQVGAGTGMLCVENPDDSAARYLRLLGEAGIEVSDTLSWNSYPWYIGRQPNDDELDSAMDVLEQIIELMPRLEIVMLHGISAQRAWEKLELRNPEIASRATPIKTYHTSPRVVAGKSPAERARREKKLSDDFARAEKLLSGL